MSFPLIPNIRQAKEMVTTFGGYINKASCKEGSFSFEKNITTENFPLLAERRRRGYIKTIEDYQGILDKDVLVWVSGNKLYIDDVEKTLATGVTISTDTTMIPKRLTKMGAYIIIFPDKIWYNTKDDTSGYIEASKSYTSTSITFQQVNSKGENITLWNGQGDPPDGAYKIDVKDGKSTLKVYSATGKLWQNVATTFFKITASGINTNFKKGDGVKITIDLTGITWARAKDIFVNDEGNNKRSSNFAINDLGSNYIIVPGLLDAATKTFTLPSLAVERKCPDMPFVVECQNRLWGCSSDGHEVYASKLGDPTNWNCFAGISTDSWAATVGSDKPFTGAYAYMGYPIFFKEDSLLKISISSYGAHSYKELLCRGVQEGSEKSLTQLNELLYYKSPTNVCVYDGNFPQEIGDDLNDSFTEAVGGSFDNRYYISMKDSKNKHYLFVYDVNIGIWQREDDIIVKDFARHHDDLFFVRSDNKLYSVYGSAYKTMLTLEAPIDYEAVSGYVGYHTDSRKYLSRMSIRVKLTPGSYFKLFIEYDDSGKWDYIWEENGNHTDTFAIPICPQRCDHFRYKIVGHGNILLYDVTKYLSEGSDM